MIFDKNIPTHVLAWDSIEKNIIKKLYEDIDKPAFDLKNFNPEDKIYFQSPGLSQSSIKEILKGYDYYRVKRNWPKEPSLAMQLGTFIHEQCLNKNFDNEYGSCAELSQLRSNTIKYKNLLADWQLKNPNKQFIKVDKLKMLQTIQFRLRDYPVDFSKMINELAVYFIFRGVLCKSKLDLIDEENGIIYDIKTTSKVIDRKSAQRVVLDYKYYLQAYFYSKAYEYKYFEPPKSYRIIWIETDAPYKVTVTKLDPSFVNYGMDEVLTGIELYKTYCKLEGDIITPVDYYSIDLPSWISNKIEDSKIQIDDELNINCPF